MWVVKEMAPIIAVLISEGISWVILKVLRMVTETLTLHMNCFSKMKTIKPGLCCFIAVTWNALFPEIHTQQFLPLKQYGKKLYLLLSFTLCHPLFAYIYVYIFYSLYFYVFCFVIFIEKVHIWFSKELIFPMSTKIRWTLS